MAALLVAAVEATSSNGSPLREVGGIRKPPIFDQSLYKY
jgi:hypothetical protein